MPDEGCGFHTPIHILNFNQISFLRRQITWLVRAGYTDITVLDNHSSYAPLLHYYEVMTAAGHIRVVRRDSNEHKYRVWEKHLQALDGPFVLTTSDVIPDSCCPADVVAQLARHLAENPQLFKAGLGLRVDDIPEHYSHRAKVLVKQCEYWRVPAVSGAFLADIDFTFSLCRRGSPFQYGPAVRTGWPYLARHEPWYSDSANRTEEERYYEATIEPGRGSWGRTRLPDWLLQACASIEREAPRTRLHLACGHNHFPGWHNLDASPDVGADIVFDLDQCDRHRLPLAANSVDGFFLSHHVSRIRDLGAMLGELYRVARPDARLVMRIPQPDPQSTASCRRYRRDTLPAWPPPGDRQCASRQRHGWLLERVRLVCRAGTADDVQGEEVLAHLGGRNDVVREIVIHLRACKGPHGGGHGLSHEPIVEAGTSPLDVHSAF